MCLNITHINAIHEFIEKQFITGGGGGREKSFQKLKAKRKSGHNGKIY
jgi:hypothetical protein